MVEVDNWVSILDELDYEYSEQIEIMNDVAMNEYNELIEIENDCLELEKKKII